MSSPHAQILLAPWLERDKRTGWWGPALILLTASLPTLAIWAWTSAERAGVAALVTAVVLLQVLWSVQFGGLLRQNHPHAARLVPGHQRRLREAAVGLWLLLTAGSALMLGSMFGHTLAWGLGAAGLMLLIALASRAPLLWWPLALLSGWPGFWTRNELWLALRGTAVAAYQQQPLLLAVVMLTLMAWLLCVQMQGGGSGHQKVYDRNARSRQAMLEGATGRSTLRYQGHIGLALARGFGWPFRAWMRHLLARPDTRNLLARAELGLGARSHWTALALAGVIVLSGTVLVFVLLVSLNGLRLQDILVHAKYGLSIGLTCATVGSAMGLSSALYFSRREQALMMLLPGMPRGAELNRQLVRRRLGLAFTSWLLVSALVFTVVLQGDVNDPALAFLLMGMPAGLLLMRNWAAMGPPGAQQPMLLTLLLVPLGGLVCHEALRWLGLPSWLLAASMLALTLLIGAWLWRRLASYPQAFPVGRLG